MRALRTSAEAAQADDPAQAFEIIGKAPRGRTWEAMQGLTAEMEDDPDDVRDTDAADPVLIGGVQAIDPCEIADLLNRIAEGLASERPQTTA